MPSLIIQGIEQGNHILFIENDRVYTLIHKKIKTLLTRDQVAKFHYINNFDYYCSQGRFYPPTIVEYFSVAIKPFFEKKIPVRIWGHVEWGNPTIVEFENIELIFLDFINCKY